jgi:hypothetical protein
MKLLLFLYHKCKEFPVLHRDLSHKGTGKTKTLYCGPLMDGKASLTGRFILADRFFATAGKCVS